MRLRDRVVYRLASSIFIPPERAPLSHPATLKLELYAQNRPGETGTVTLEQIPGGVTIAVKMAGGQNAHSPFIYTSALAQIRT